MIHPKAGPRESAKREVSFRSNRDVAIHVPDLAKAREFYGDVLGFEVLNRGGDQLAFDTGTFRLWVNKHHVLRSYIPSFDVADYQAARSYLEAAGSTPASPDSTSYFKDPFGFVFDIIEHR